MTAEPTGDEKRPLSVAVLGAQHPHIFPRLDLLTGTFSEECEVTGLYDRDARVRDHVSATYGIAVHDDPHDALQGAPDVVIVNGLDSENPELIRLALPGPRAVLLEKVGAPTVARMRELVEYCAQYPAHVTVGFILHNSPVVPKLRQIVDSGVLGPITLARFHAATPVGCSAEIWQSIPEDLGGMVFTDGIHMVREIIGLLGVPDRVSARIRKLSARQSVSSDIFKEDILSGLGGEQDFEIGGLRYEDAGVLILDYAEHVAVMDMTAWEAHNWVEKWRLELYGANATLEAGLMPPFYRLQVRRPNDAFGVGVHEQSFSDGASAGAAISLVPDITYQNEMRALLAAARAGSTDQSELRAALQCVEILGAAFEASDAFSGIPVPAVAGWRS
jgi:predicted dehydrogenase